MRRIRTLPRQLANQIAAGEVVERPASVVKELLENSLDAGARQLTVELERGGVGLIRIGDDGGGIHRDDLLLALSPHATSKLYEPDELERVASLGFRGEALASIASVSRLRIASRLAGEEAAWEVAADGGELPEAAQPAAQPQGTVVEVRELFYNTPARRKFLRSERTELGHIQETVRRIVLSRPGLGLELSHGGNRLLRVRPAADAAGEARRVAAVVGEGFMRSAVAVQFSDGGLRLRGWIGRPEAARAQADVQYVFLNGRAIRDRLVGHALRQAHQAAVEEGRHPAYVLFLELDPAQVDVNVHPTKHEVRFRDARRVHDFLVLSVREALAAQPAMEPVCAAPPVERATETAAGRYTPPLSRTTRLAAPTPVREQRGFYDRLFPPAPSGPAAAPAVEPLRHLATDGGYLLAQGAEGLMLVDLAAARRCWGYQRMLRTLREAGAVKSVPLLLPASVALDAARAARVEALRAAWAVLGLEVDRLGETTAVVRAVPAPLREADGGALLRELVPLEEAEPETALWSMARHLADTRLERAERDDLLQALAAGLDCSRGGRLAVPLDGERLARWFAEAQGAQ